MAPEVGTAGEGVLAEEDVSGMLAISFLRQGVFVFFAKIHQTVRNSCHSPDGYVMAE